MPRSLVLTACLLAMATAVSTWFWWPRTITPPRYDQDGNLVGSQALDPTSGDTGTTRLPNHSGAAMVAPASTQLLRVQLRGLHADAPWTTPLQLELQDRGRGRAFGQYTTASDVQPDGHCDLPLPAWWHPGLAVKLRITGDHPHYRQLDHRGDGGLPQQDELTLAVEAIADLNGQVTDSHGEPIANARITAFRMQAGQPSGPAVGTAGSDARGNYLLQAPPDQSLLIVATAMQPNATGFRGLHGICDNGELRADLLPAHLVVQLAINHPGTECNFALVDAATITGSVRWPDAQPVDNATVRFSSEGGSTLAISEQAVLHWQMDRTLTPSGTMRTDAAGRFAVPAHPGASLSLFVIHLDTCPIIGTLPTHQVTAPAQHEFTLPFPVTLRATHNDQLVPYASILLHERPPLRAAADGTCQALFADQAMIRAERGALRSPWQSIASSHLQQTVDFAMSNQLAELQIEFEGPLTIRRATLQWRCEDGRSLTEHVERADTQNPFAIWLEPGNYTLRITGPAEEHSDSYLLPLQRKFHIRPTSETDPALRLDLPARFGGTFTLRVLDQNSSYVAGKCTIVSPDGKEHTAPMTSDGAPGVFPAATARCANILPAGPYELVIDLGKLGVHKQYVNIKARETASVVLRL